MHVHRLADSYQPGARIGRSTDVRAAPGPPGAALVPRPGLEDDPRNRTDFALLLMRFMACDEGWEQSPVKAATPGTEAEVMWPYYPRGFYTTKEEFEANGPRTDLGWPANR